MHVPVVLRRRLLDIAPAAALIVIGAVQLLADYQGSGFRGPRGANAAFLVMVCLPLLVRRRHPVLALAGVFVIQGIWVGAYYHGSHQPPFEPFAAGVVACFALGLHADRRALHVGLGVFAVLVVASAVVLAVGGSAVGDALSVLIWWAAAIGIGRGLRERQARVELLRERSARLERDRERDMADGGARGARPDRQGAARRDRARREPDGRAGERRAPATRRRPATHR